ncbi:SLC13 family permease [Hydrogenophilus islandicus]
MSTAPWDVAVSNDLVIALFALTYLGIALGRIPWLAIDRTGVALLGALAIGLVSGADAAKLTALVDWSTIALLYALMLFSAQLRLGGFYTFLAVRLVASALQAPRRFLAVQMAVSGFLAAFLSNDVICLAVAPVLLETCRTARISPMPHLLGLAMAANIGSAATLIGNPQNMLIGQLGGLAFGGYFVWSVVPVVLALTAAYAILRWQFADALAVSPVGHVDGGGLAQGNPPFDRWQSSKGVVLLVVLVALFLTDIPREHSALALAGVLLLSRRMATRELLSLIDWHLITLFLALFVVVGLFRETGAPAAIMAWIAERGGSVENPLFLTLLTVVLSNLVSNVPAVMLLTQFLTPGDPGPWYLLAVASTFAGNLLLVGSIANLIVAEQAARYGVAISFGRYLRSGLWVTAASMLILVAWFSWVAP